MSSSTDSDHSKGAGPDTPVNTGVLKNFVHGLKEKIGPEFGRVCTQEERWEVKRKIARELGVEEDYDPERWPDPEGGPGLQARRKVNGRYNELEDQGRIVEAGQLAELQEWSAKISAHLRGEECFFSEDHPHTTWPPPEEPSEDPSEGVGCFPEIETDPRE